MDSPNPYGYSHNGHNQPPHPADHQPYPAYYQPPPPGADIIYPPSGGDNSYYTTQPPPVQPYAYHQPPPVASYDPPANQPPASAPDGEKSLTSKFAGLMSRRSSTSSSSSSCCSSSDDDDDKKKKQKKKKKKKKMSKKARPAYATPPASNPHDGPHPFSIFTPKDDPAHIVLTLSPAGGATAHLTGPRSSKPAFKITWSADAAGRHNIMRHSLPALSASHPTWAGLGRADREGKLWFQFPWGDWGDVDCLADYWASDVGFRTVRKGEDVWLQWSLVTHMDAATNGRFTARCFDTDARGMPEVIRVEVEGEGRWTLVVPVELVQTEEQLDEIVTVACTVVRRMAEMVRKTETE